MRTISDGMYFIPRERTSSHPESVDGNLSWIMLIHLFRRACMWYFVLMRKMPERKVMRDESDVSGLILSKWLVFL